jgi:hypothetical protein
MNIPIATATVTTIICQTAGFASMANLEGIAGKYFLMERRCIFGIR